MFKQKLNKAKAKEAKILNFKIFLNNYLRFSISIFVYNCRKIYISKHTFY